MSRFLDACFRRPVDVTPVWMMRQAGRSLPAYRALREKHSFLDLIKQPELMAEITLMPLQYLEVDAAVMFADIMLPLSSLGIEFDIVESVGPVVDRPVRTIEQVESLEAREVTEVAPAVFEAIRLVRKELSPDIALIGFSGAPFTLASYLIEGKPSREMIETKRLMFSEPALWDGLMQRLSDLVVSYLKEQVSAGAQALQLFDSWMGTLSPQDYEKHVLPHTQRIFREVAFDDVPRIHFGTGTPSLLELMARPDCEVIGIDWRTPLDEARRRVGAGRAVQGNLEPAVLLGPAELVVGRAHDVLARAGGKDGHVFNLGHGVLPDTPLENLQLLVDTVHEHRS